MPDPHVPSDLVDEIKRPGDVGADDRAGVFEILIEDAFAEPSSALASKTERAACECCQDLLVAFDRGEIAVDSIHPDAVRAQLMAARSIAASLATHARRTTAARSCGSGIFGNGSPSFESGTARRCPGRVVEVAARRLALCDGRPRSSGRNGGERDPLLQVQGGKSFNRGSNMSKLLVASALAATLTMTGAALAESTNAATPPHQTGRIQVKARL